MKEGADLRPFIAKMCMFYGKMNKKRSFKLQSFDTRLSEFLMFVFLGHGDSVFGGTDSGSGH